MSGFARPGRRAPRIYATFDSVCSCGRDIWEGDDIYKFDGEWICAECASEEGVD